MSDVSIIVEVTDFKSGPATAREFGGRFDRETKTWTIPVYKRNFAHTSHLTKLIHHGHTYGLRVLSADIAIGDWDATSEWGIAHYPNLKAS